MAQGGSDGGRSCGVRSEDSVRIELTVRYQYPREKSLYKLTKMYTEHKDGSDSEFVHLR